VIGVDYSRYRRPDPFITSQLRDALGDARTVLNVGAGAGSYEPTDIEVTAVKPSAAMRGQVFFEGSLVLIVSTGPTQR
jgi:hypothetical protein